MAPEQKISQSSLTPGGMFYSWTGPYGMGSQCKHEAAVLYALRKVLKDGPAGLTVDSPGGLAASAGKIMKP